MVPPDCVVARSPQRSGVPYQLLDGSVGFRYTRPELAPLSQRARPTAFAIQVPQRSCGGRVLGCGGAGVEGPSGVLRGHNTGERALGEILHAEALTGVSGGARERPGGSGGALAAADILQVA